MGTDLRLRYWILNTFVKENLTKFKWNEIEVKLLVLLESPWWVGFLASKFVIFRLKVGGGEDIEFWAI
jgi:hypothetical protein